MKKILGIIMTLTLCVFVSGCKSDEADKAYAVTVKGVNIVVGETKMEALKDSEYLREVNFDQMLQKNSYYQGIAMYTEDREYIGSIEVLSENEASLKDAIIASISVKTEDLSKVDITFEGVQLKDITLDKAKELMPGADGDEESVFDPGSGDYYTSLGFDENTLTRFETKRNYDVDYSKGK